MAAADKPLLVPRAPKATPPINGNRPPSFLVLSRPHGLVRLGHCRESYDRAEIYFHEGPKRAAIGRGGERASLQKQDKKNKRQLFGEFARGKGSATRSVLFLSIRCGLPFARPSGAHFPFSTPSRNGRQSTTVFGPGRPRTTTARTRSRGLRLFRRNATSTTKTWQRAS